MARNPSSLFTRKTVSFQDKWYVACGTDGSTSYYVYSRPFMYKTIVKEMNKKHVKTEGLFSATREEVVKYVLNKDHPQINFSKAKIALFEVGDLVFQANLVNM